MDMYQKRKMRQEKKNSQQNKESEKIQLNCLVKISASTMN